MQTKAAAHPSMTLSTWGLLVLLGLIWGGSFFFARVAIHHVPAFTLVLLRLSIAALALHLFILGRHDFYQTLRDRWPQFALLGLINNAIPHTFIFLGQTHIGAGLAAILNATTPIWTVLIAHMTTSDEKLSPRKPFGCISGLAGTVVLIGPAATGGPTVGVIPLWALLLPIGAAISYGFAAIYGRRFRGIAPPVIAAGQMTASALIMLPVSLLSDHPWTLPMPPLGAVASILALALISTAYGYILFFRIMARAGATNTSLVTLLVPPSAILLGVIILGETLEWTDLGGMLLIAAGLVILDGRLWQRISSTR